MKKPPNTIPPALNTLLAELIEASHTSAKRDFSILRYPSTGTDRRCDKYILFRCGRQHTEFSPYLGLLEAPMMVYMRSVIHGLNILNGAGCPLNNIGADRDLAYSVIDTNLVIRGHSAPFKAVRSKQRGLLKVMKAIRSGKPAPRLIKLEHLTAYTSVM